MPEASRMAIAHLAELLVCLLSLTAARFSESITIATTNSNTPPFSLSCGTHYLCKDPFQKIVSVQFVSVNVIPRRGNVEQCPSSESLSISSQAQAFLNGCASGGDSADVLTLKSSCLVQASGSVQIVYNCEAAAITATTPASDVTGDDDVGTSTQQRGRESSSQTAAGATAAAVVLSLTACSVAGMVLVCWRSGLFCFADCNASRHKAPASPPSASGTRVFSTEQQPVGRLHYACTPLVQEGQQGQQPAESHQRPLVGTTAPSVPAAVLRYVSLTEEEDHCYEALPDIQDEPLPYAHDAAQLANDQQVVYDMPAVSSSPELPSHFLRDRDSVISDPAVTLPPATDPNLYFTIEPPTANQTGGVHPNSR